MYDILRTDIRGFGNPTVLARLATSFGGKCDHCAMYQDIFDFFPHICIGSGRRVPKGRLTVPGEPSRYKTQHKDQSRCHQPLGYLIMSG